MITFNDDEPFVAAPDLSGWLNSSYHAGEEASSSKLGTDGKIELRIINKREAPLEACKFKILVELTGSGGLGNERIGVDLVAVFDVGEATAPGPEDKLASMKWGMRFLIQKLSPIDRLSIVAFSVDSRRLCPLRRITEESQAEIGILVNDLVSEEGRHTDMGAGLETGLRVLNERKQSSGRVAAIMLVSDGHGRNTAHFPAVNVPVFTFGLGAGHDPFVLNSIAANSNGGTFSDVQNSETLSIAFSQCLDGLLTVAVQDLKLSLTSPQKSVVIQGVSAGNYPKSTVSATAAGGHEIRTVSFGDLYDKELRRVAVDLLLPAALAVRTPSEHVLEVTCAYSVGGQQLDGPAIMATITRTAGATIEQEREEVTTEVNLLRAVRTMKAARLMADDNHLGGAKDKLAEAYTSLVGKKPNQLIEMVKIDLQMLTSLMASQDRYDKQGRTFALSSETSHERQRFATRGAVPMPILRLFSTPEFVEEKVVSILRFFPTREFVKKEVVPFPKLLPIPTQPPRLCIPRKRLSSNNSLSTTVEDVPPTSSVNKVLQSFKSIFSSSKRG